MTPEIIPSRLYKPKVFEAISRYAHEDGGRRLLDATPSLEEQMSAWVDQTRNLIVAFGPMMVCAGDDNGVWIETRTIALTYVPAVEQGNHVKPYGEAAPERPGQVAAVPQPPKPTGTGGHERAAENGGGGRKPLRVPVIP